MCRLLLTRQHQESLGELKQAEAVSCARSKPQNATTQNLHEPILLFSLFLVLVRAEGFEPPTPAV